jgi:hypothetical protein
MLLPPVMTFPLDYPYGRQTILLPGFWELLGMSCLKDPNEKPMRLAREVSQPIR